MDKAELGKIVKACVRLQNMIVNDERNSYDLAFDYDHVKNSIPKHNVCWDHHPCYATYFRRIVQIRDLDLHARIQLFFMQEIWRRHSGRQGSKSQLLRIFSFVSHIIFLNLNFCNFFPLSWTLLYCIFYFPFANLYFFFPLYVQALYSIGLYSSCTFYFIVF